MATMSTIVIIRCAPRAIFGAIRPENVFRKHGSVMKSSTVFTITITALLILSSKLKMKIPLYVVCIFKKGYQNFLVKLLPF